MSNKDKNTKLIDKNGKEYISYTGEWGELYKRVINNAGKIIAIITIMISVISIYLKFCWYVFELGYISVFGVDRSFIDIGDYSLYEALKFVGIVVVILFSNYVFYDCVVYRKVRVAVIFLVVESISIVWLVCLYENISFYDEIKWMIKTGAILQNFKYVIVLFVEINIFGIIYGTADVVAEWKHKKKKSNAMQKNGDKRDTKKVKQPSFINRFSNRIFGISERVYASITQWIFLLVCLILLNIPFLMDVGRTICIGKKDYKVIFEKVDDTDLEMNNKYNFLVEEYNETKAKDIYVNVGVIVYENRENYIINYLVKEGGKVNIDKTRQKVMGKEDVTTYYLQDYANVCEVFTIK